MDKKELRKYINHILPRIKDKNYKSFLIEGKIYPIINERHVIALYMALDNEVNLDSLIIRLIKAGKVIAIPKVENDSLTFYQIKNINDCNYSSNKFKIREPISGTAIKKEDIEIIIIPGLAFDKNNNRLGRGKGYYDKYLKGTSCYKIGVAFDEQLFDDIPHDENDIKMDEIITDVL